MDDNNIFEPDPGNEEIDRELAASGIDMQAANERLREMVRNKPSHLPVTAAWFRGYDAGQKRAIADAEKMDRRLREVVRLAKKQRVGGYTTESDATIALVLIQSLATALLGEDLPVAGSKEDV